VFTVSAYAASSVTSPLRRTSIERRALGPRDVLIDVKFCGVCHSDIHMVRGDWTSPSTGVHVSFPLVPGHEITGIVSAVGPEVTTHSVGDRVGVGCLVDSCRQCINCANGLEQHCLSGCTLTYGSVGKDGAITQGGYATRIVVTEDYVLRIPDGLVLESAAPLLCAGITAYSPLSQSGAGPGRKVAIVGLGGLGHIAVKLAHALGAEVSVLSQSLKKHEDGLRLGADHYYATSDPQIFEQLANSFDLILNTVSVPIDVDAYLGLLATNGSLVNVGLPAEPLQVNVFKLLYGRRTFSGSFIGGIQETQEMLDFCAQHHIGADIEIINADRINEAFERVVASDVRYRFVIDVATIDARCASH
jgi:uncharacterized zinc-type alcohol dehydrogenase-like protein